MGSGLPEAKLLCFRAPLHAFKGSRAAITKIGNRGIGESGNQGIGESGNGGIWKR